MGAPRRIWVYQGFVDLIQREALVAGQRHALSPTEVALLDYLEARAGQTVGRAELLKEVWGYHERVVSRTLDTTVARLRVKVEADPANPRHMLTVSGEGYRFRPLGEPLGGRLGQSPLVGRATALEALDRHAALGVPVVTVCGLGGMGKSRLVSAWAEQRGVPMIEVAALSSPEEVRAALAAALGVSDGAGWSRLGEVLGQGRLPAIVLDQVEHLLPALLAPMATLTRRSGAGAGASVVLTSRVPVNAPGERLIELGPLSPEEALTLYELRRSGARDPDAPELLARVGHIPLAVELVAARSRSMSARDQIRTLGLGLLEDPSDPGRSVRRSIAGAWSTLEARERRGLRALVVFRGAFTVEAAIAVLGDEPQRALTVLHHLRERALVSPAPGAEGRSNVLEPIRWFVAEALPHDGGATLRHAAWFGRWVSDELRARLDTDEGAPRAAIAAEAPELLAALSSALELGRPDLAAGAWLGVFEVTRLDGRFAGEVARLGERVLGADGLDEHTLIAVASRLGDVQRRRGRTAEARALTAEATERAEVLGDARLLAFCAHAQGIAIYDDGDLGAAEALAQRAQALARTAGAPEIEAGGAERGGRALAVAGAHHDVVEAGDPVGMRGRGAVRSAVVVAVDGGEPVEGVVDAIQRPAEDARSTCAQGDHVGAAESEAAVRVDGETGATPRVGGVAEGQSGELVRPIRHGWWSHPAAAIVRSCAPCWACARGWPSCDARSPSSSGCAST